MWFLINVSNLTATVDSVPVDYVIGNLISTNKRENHNKIRVLFNV